jgi:hypothetical protein
MRPISTQVNKPESDDPSILKPVDAQAEAAFTAFLSRAMGCRAGARGRISFPDL